jgi:putative lipoprotein
MKAPPLLMMLLLTACAGAQDTRIVARGNVVIGPEVRTIVECGSERNAWLIDETHGELRRWYDALSIEPYQPLFFELSGYGANAPDSGFGADYSSAFRVTAVRRAEREGFGCDEELSGFRFQARGNEPSWRLVASPSALKFDALGESSLTLNEPVETVDDASIRFEAAGNNSSILVAVEPGQCVDSMSGSLYAFRARVSVNGAIYSGCAIAGTAPPR